MKLVIVFLLFSTTAIGQIMEVNPKTLEPLGPTFDSKGMSRMVFVGMGIGTTWQRDSVFLRNNQKTTLPNACFNFQFGKQNQHIKIRTGIDFGTHPYSRGWS